MADSEGKVTRFVAVMFYEKISWSLGRYGHLFVGSVLTDLKMDKSETRVRHAWTQGEGERPFFRSIGPKVDRRAVSRYQCSCVCVG
jgi:hypothetical protein